MSRRNGEHKKDPYATERRRLEELDARRQDKPYDPRKMEIKIPLGCTLIGLILAGTLFWAAIYFVIRKAF